VVTGAPNPADFVGLEPDERLLGDDMRNLPTDMQPPPVPVPARRGRSTLAAAGATLTGATLLGGIALVVYGIVDAISSAFGAIDAAAIAVGALLVATHWGWIHITEATADTLDARRHRALRAGQLTWLLTVEPYTRYSIATSVLEDGSIRIARSRHQPVQASGRTFSFAREPESDEVISADEPAAIVTERAETLRRLAARETERERRRWEIAADAYETALLGRDDDEQRAAARRAAAEALSAQINAHLREPPLVE